MSSVRWLSFALLALACTPRAASGGGPFPVDAGGGDATAPADLGGGTDAPAPPTDSPAPPTDTPPVTTDTPAVTTDTPPVTTDACAPAGAEAAACRDGRDNDCNGFIDCADPACAAACAPDSGCVRTGNEDDNAQCSDGRDNDCDGFIDCVDFSCRMNPAVTVCAVDAGCVPSPENANNTCSDGLDNDCDGFRDCSDFDCSRSPQVTICPRDGGAPFDSGCVPSLEDNNLACADGRDNDCDGFRDCDDFDCSRSSAVTICPRDAGVSRDVIYRDVVRGDAAGCVRSGDENTPTACTDGRDNDCDGFLDCDDRNCSCVGGCLGAIVGCACRGIENNNTVCARNGVDEDCNGFTDCDDFGCSRNPLVTVCTP